MKQSIFSLLLVFFIAGCSHKGEKNVLKEHLISYTNKFVDQKYVDREPLAAIIDVPVKIESSEVFTLNNNTDIQIYGVGELIYNLAESKREYFLKGDDIELFFKVNYSGSEGKKSFVFLWENGVEERKVEIYKKNLTTIYDNGGICYGYRNSHQPSQKYISLIKIPLNTIGVRNPKAGLKIQFDIAIGDADDYFSQNNKLSWHSSQDMLVTSSTEYGTLEFVGDKVSKTDTTLMTAINSTPISNWNHEFWKDIPGTELRKEVFGNIKDKYDLSSKVKSCWNRDTLYFYVETQDSQRKRIGANTKRKKRTLADYAWIEDARHNKVWEMHALDTKYAGGALKNHKIDTIINLKSGKYYLKYYSDESHAWNNWDDDQPKTPFYGVVIYKK